MGKTQGHEGRAAGRGETSWTSQDHLAHGEVTVTEPLPKPTQPSRVTIERAVKAFLDELQETAAFAAHKKYRLLPAKFKEFSEKRGYVRIDQWEPTDVREFRTSWAINPQTGATRPEIEALLAAPNRTKWLGRRTTSCWPSSNNSDPKPPDYGAC